MLQEVFWLEICEWKQTQKKIQIQFAAKSIGIFQKYIAMMNQVTTWV